MDAVLDKAREGRVRQGPSAHMSSLRCQDPAQVDAEEAPDQCSSTALPEWEERLDWVLGSGFVEVISLSGTL